MYRHQRVSFGGYNLGQQLWVALPDSVMPDIVKGKGESVQSCDDFS